MKLQRIHAYRVKSGVWSFVRLVIVFGLCFEVIYPFLVKTMQMFMSTTDLNDPTVQLYPKNFSVQFIVDAFKLVDYPKSALTTLLVALSTSIIQTLICTAAGYGFARFKFKGRAILFGLVLFALMVPPAVYSVPLYLRFRYFSLGFTTLKLVDNVGVFLILALTGLGLKNGLFIYLMRQFFKGMPKELEEAAYIDGSGVYSTYLRVMMPNARNMMLTIFILSFAWQWTDVFYSTLLTSEMMTLPAAILKNIRTVALDGSTRDGMVYSILRNTAGLLTIAPLLVIFGVVQKQLIQGIERSGIVG